MGGEIYDDLWPPTRSKESKRMAKLTATWRSLRMAWLFPVPQYAMASVYMPDRRKMGSLSWQRLVMRGSASSRRPYIVSAMPTARPRRIFSCWVSWAYWNKEKQMQWTIILKQKTVSVFYFNKLSLTPHSTLSGMTLPCHIKIDSVMVLSWQLWSRQALPDFVLHMAQRKSLFKHDTEQAFGSTDSKTFHEVTWIILKMVGDITFTKIHSAISQSYVHRRTSGQRQTRVVVSSKELPHLTSSSICHIAGNWNAQVWSNIHTKFRKNPFKCSQVIIWQDK